MSIEIEEGEDGVYFSTPQRDDGNRNALNHFMEQRDFKTAGLIAFCVRNKEYWKARVFLELLWEYESSLKSMAVLRRYHGGDGTVTREQVLEALCMAVK